MSTAIAEKAPAARVSFEVDKGNYLVIRMIGPGAAMPIVRESVKRLLDDDDMFYTMSPAKLVGGEYVANISLNDYWHRGFTRERADWYAKQLGESL